MFYFTNGSGATCFVGFIGVIWLFMVIGAIVRAFRKRGCTVPSKGSVVAAFRYKAMTDNGHEVEGELEANSKEDAIAQIRELSYFPLWVRQQEVKVRICPDEKCASHNPPYSRFCHRCGVSLA